MSAGLVISVSLGNLGPGNIRLSTDLIGDLDGNLLADRLGNLLANRSGNLPGVLLGDLLALLLNMLLALRSAGVSISRSTSISLSLSLSILAISTISSGNDLGVVSNHSAGVVHLLLGLLAVLGHNVLALLNVGGVHDGVILLMALLLIHLGALLVILGGVLGGAVLLVVAIVVGTTISTWSGHGSGGKASKGNKSQHFELKV